VTKQLNPYPAFLFASNKRSPSPYINRFLSADTIVPGYANPQSLNRYSYVLNNPLRYTDPTGHRVCEDDGGTCLSENQVTQIWNKPQHNNHQHHDTDVAHPVIDPISNDSGLLSSASDNLCVQGNYSPRCPSWHFYTSTHLVCPKQLHCSEEEIIDYLSRFAYPGQYPFNPVQNTDIHPVGLGPFSLGSLNLGPYSMGALGQIQTFVSNGGLTIKNVTQPGHIFYDGIIIRTAYQDEKGAWYVSTYGYGNNVNLGMDTVNQVFGPGIFNAVDQSMISTIEAHH
jgi:hypothetical protein